MLKTAIIGISGYGAEHLRLLLRGSDQGKLIPQAAVVVNPEEVPEGLNALRSRGCRIYNSVEKMFAEENGNIDLCMIPTPISTHYPFTKLALEQGAHVFLEKPACGTIQEATELADLADQKGLHIAMGFQDLYNPQVRLIKQKLANGEFGKVRSIRGWGNWPRSTGYYSRNAWAGQLRDGTGWVLDSPVNNAMAHFLNLMLYWAGADADSFGEPETIEGDLYRVQGIDSFDTASMRILVKDGPALFYGVSHSGCTYENPIIRVDCENGWVEWDHCGSIRYMKDGEETSFAQPMMDVIRDGMLEVIWSNCCSGSGGVVSIRDAMVHLLCVNALHDASEIRDIPGDFRRTKATKAGEFICVDEICPLLKRAFDEMKLLKELPCPWQEAEGVLIPLAEYKRFCGGYVALASRHAP